MVYTNQIGHVAAGFPGILNRVHVLNSQLELLARNGLGKLVDNFLFQQSVYTLMPLLFEIFIGRWILSLADAGTVEHEPPAIDNPPDFRFEIGNQISYIEAKTLIQINYEEMKQKIVKQIDDRTSSSTKNVLEICLSENVEPKDLNRTVHWIVSKAAKMSVGEKETFRVDDEIMAWVKVAWVSDRGGHVGIEHFGATMNGLPSEIKTGKVREKIRQKMKQANRTSYRDVLYGQKQTTPRFMWIHLNCWFPREA